MADWLNSHTKKALVDLAKEADIKSANTHSKSDLVDLLVEVLDQNAPTLSQNSDLAEYYIHAAGEGGAVIKKSATVSPDVERAPRTVKRRQTKASEDNASDASPAPKTNRAARTLHSSSTPRVSNIQDVATHFPSSPAAVAEMVERQSSALTQRASLLMQQTGVSEHLTSARESLSTVVAIQGLLAILEAYGLQKLTLPWRHAFYLTLPGAWKLPFTGSSIKFPDFFVLLTSDFWVPTALWFLASIALPLAAGWVFNLTRIAGVSRKHQYTVDPVAFSIAKAFIAYLLEYKQYRFAAFSTETVSEVYSAMPWGFDGVLIGCGIGVVAGFYEAVLVK